MERTVFFWLTNHEGDQIILPELMEATDESHSQPPNAHNLVGKGIRYHPSHAAPSILIPRTPILHKHLIDRYIDGGLTPIEYVKWLKNWRQSALPGWVTIESDNPNWDFDAPVLIDFESHSIEHGQEDNIPYSLTFYEFIDEKVEVIPPTPTGQEYPTPTPEPRPDTKPPTPRTHTVRSGESLYAITRQFTGSGAGWRELYGLNAELIHRRADPSRQGSLIFAGQELVIPEAWR